MIRSRKNVRTARPTTSTSGKVTIDSGTSTSNKRRYMPGLDGLRALAVLAVLLYHLDLSAVPGGFLGVGVFFVLSGYLITDLLAAEWRKQGRINLKNFWVRRFRRLLPALAVFLLVVALWTLFTDTSRLKELSGNILTAALYVNNWWLIFHQVSYFESFGPPSPVGHLWSLAVEEQFYVLWPFLMLLGFRFVRIRGRLFGLIMAGAAASAIAMAVLYEPGSDPSRVYYGTDTRAFGLLIGAALAIVWPSARLSESASPRSRLAIDLVGGAGLLTIIVMIGRVSEFDAFLYQGGFVVLSAATAAAVAALAHPGSRLGVLMSWKPLRWMGTRSYGIYLWHYFVICITKPAIQTGEVNPAFMLFQIALSFVLAELSWRFVEEPVRSGKAGQVWKNVRRQQKLRRQSTDRRPSRRWRTAAWLTPLFIIGMIAAVNRDIMIFDSMASSVPDQETVQLPQQPADNKNGSNGSLQPPPHNNTGISERKNTDSSSSEGKGSTGSAGSRDGKESGDSQPPNRNEPKQPPSEIPDQPSVIKPAEEKSSGSENGNNEKRDNQSSITAIGDSVLLGASKELEALLPGIIIDAKIGRQMSQAVDAAAALKAKGRLGSHVIIELGTNGLFTKKQLTALLDSLQDAKQILLVNTRVPRRWEKGVNDMLSKTAVNYTNVTIVDWYQASAGKDAYFEKDGVHLNAEGAKAYVSLIAKAVK
ncbi:acyltransferase family protein [Paenibacillus spongiae]|uniref:Acyltransferase family protein n=1 Tax=Paenibacillus spongiae TaxID=2909671 RepID=A0ABY5S185_9BACL|nr:acyltransferase family protein [Paenibacillus spongiae]UVI27626.1 acyltransferase family protein [Paenibacillus spongiae]